VTPQAEAESSTVPSFDSTIEREVFDQLLEMDDEDDRTFSQEIVWNFFEQATSTFADMDTALEEKDLAKLSTLGHFLKGSSAAVGVAHVRDLCEAMQHLGKLHDESGVEDISREEALSKLQTTIKDVKARYQDAEAVLKKFYEDEGMPGGPDGADEGEEEDD
ncbi:histidine-phosphotransfer domain, HPT domain-containing protein, partial [Microstroma glucosiphilum]